MSQDTLNPFALNKIKSKVLKFAIQKISKIDILEQWYANWLEMHGGSINDADAFITYVLNCIGVTSTTVNENRLDDVPQDGAFIYVANHPLGGIEGMMLTQILKRVRPDLKVLTNEMLSEIAEFKDVFIGVDSLNPERTEYNAKGMREVAKHLSKGGALLVFPAGTVSQIKLPSLKIVDAHWNTMISRLARKYKAPIMPIFVDGENSKLFYLSAYIHRRLRTLLLPRAMINKSAEVINLHFGQVITQDDLKRLSDDNIAMHYIRLCCKVMSAAADKEQSTSSNSHMASIKQDIPDADIKAHLETLKDCILYEKGSFSLYCASYDQLGPLMEQLSIERERTFRAVDEGTGKEIDSDRFDPHYMHLFMWDNAQGKIAGGYRLGKTDVIVKEHGLNGLYSHSLFDYDEAFLENMGKTLELGRSFITKDYQKSPTALDLLWKGIGHFIAKNPEYYTIFGCVSISKQYSGLASAILTDTFLTHYGVKDDIAKKVKARTPLKRLKAPWTPEQLAHLCEIPVINKLVGRIDNGKSVPVLIRQYLALNGRFISFTVNTGFNDALDGLMMTDLRTTEARYLKRYMGEDGLETFTAYHDSFFKEKDSLAVEVG